jgi:hypothetical protein
VTWNKNLGLTSVLQDKIRRANKQAFLTLLIDYRGVIVAIIALKFGSGSEWQ